MIAGAYIMLGYALLVIECGWPGVLVSVIHAGILVAGTWRRRR